MINSLKITVLSENTSFDPALKAEHGFSLHIEADGKEYLFDTGAGNQYIANAELLGVNLDSIETVILSHSHYDHTGGLEFLFDKKIYIHEQFFKQKHKKIKGEYIDIGTRRPEDFYVQKNQLKFIKIKALTSITENIKLVCNFQKMPYDDYFYLQQNDQMLPDFFQDEVALTIATTKGLVVITGCSHSGIINILEKIAELNQSNKVYALLGGLHLSKLDEEANKIVAEQLNQYQITNLGISHCTGDKLAKYLTPGTFFNFNTGDSFKL